MPPSPTASAALQPPRSRLVAIDALRGLVIAFMLLDHVRETFYLHQQVSDPMDVSQTPPELFFSRLLAHLCAPIFVFLTGLSAFLYGSRYGEQARASASEFLFKRGLFLVLLEVTVINFAWTFEFPPTRVFLQVIWAIGLSMLALSALLWLPRRWLIAVALALVAGHNLLDTVHFAAGHVLHVPWAILHDRSWLDVTETLRLRTSYPVLPWIGVIALGYAAGPWFTAPSSPALRQRRLLQCGVGLLAAFVVLRALNVYGDTPWQSGATALESVMSFVNITKYPPSLLFIALTLGIGLLILRAFDRHPDAAWLRPLTVFGAAPMFFYILHLYVLKLLYIGAVSIWGTNQGDYFGFDGVGPVWLCALLLGIALYPAVKAFAAFKARRRDIVWLKYL